VAASLATTAIGWFRSLVRPVMLMTGFRRYLGQCSRRLWSRRGIRAVSLDKFGTKHSIDPCSLRFEQVQPSLIFAVDSVV
jgi:hypothetical protein